MGESRPKQQTLENRVDKQDAMIHKLQGLVIQQDFVMGQQKESLEQAYARIDDIETALGPELKNQKRLQQWRNNKKDLFIRRRTERSDGRTRTHLVPVMK